jgi:hypothetical protein
MVDLNIKPVEYVTMKIVIDVLARAFDYDA